MIDLGEILPAACDWASRQERIVLRSGAALDTFQLADARGIGLLHPEEVRVLKVTAIPLPQDPRLAAAAQATKLISPETWGLTLRYGILMRSDRWGDRGCLVHELVHVKQYEERGGFEGFLRPYLLECIDPGYGNGPLEREAILTEERYRNMSKTGDCR